MSFYMTLTSDSSRRQFPANRFGNYNTPLAQQVVLEGQYEVGLSELLLPAPNTVFAEVQYIMCSTPDDVSQTSIKIHWIFSRMSWNVFECTKKKRIHAV